MYDSFKRDRLIRSRLLFSCDVKRIQNNGAITMNVKGFMGLLKHKTEA